MNGYELSYEEIYGLDEDDTEEDKLKSKIDKLKEKNEWYEDKLNWLRRKIEIDMKLNEETVRHSSNYSPIMVKIYGDYLKYDKELLEIIDEKL